MLFEMAEPKKKIAYVTNAQKNQLLELIKNEPDLLSGKFSSTFTYKEGQRKWQQIAEILNGIPGAYKDWKQWRKDIRSKTKSKCAAVKKYSRGTGGGPSAADSLTKLDNNVLDIITITSVEGHKESCESVATFNFEDEDKDGNKTQEEEIGNKSSETQNNPDSPKQNTPKKQKQTIKKKVHRSLSAADVMAETSKRKLALKENYYKGKLKILKERNEILASLVTVVKEKKCSFCSTEDILLNKI